MWRGIDWLISVLSGEWLLHSRPNGGAVILVRSVFVATVFFVLAIGLDAKLTPGSSWSFDSQAFLAAIRAHLPWFGAFFAGAYAAFYARFASQWTYLAGVYNEIMSAQARSPQDDDLERRRVYTNWKAGFIEDADSVHLALKPLYASVIQDMLRDEAIRNAFVENTVGGAFHLRRLETAISQVIAREERRWQRRILRSSQPRHLASGPTGVVPEGGGDEPDAPTGPANPDSGSTRPPIT